MPNKLETTRYEIDTTHALGAESQSQGTIQLVPKSWKMTIMIPWRRGGTWEGVPVEPWYSEWICTMRGGLVHHTIMIPAALSLPLLRGACSMSLTIFQNDWFCTRISNFFQSPIFSIASMGAWEGTRTPPDYFEEQIWGAVRGKKLHKSRNCCALNDQGCGCIGRVDSKSKCARSYNQIQTLKKMSLLSCLLLSALW